MTSPKLTLLDIKDKANILFEKLTSDKYADSTSCELPVSTYILTSALIEGIDPEESRKLMIEYLYKIKSRFSNKTPNERRT